MNGWNVWAGVLASRDSSIAQLAVLALHDAAKASGNDGSVNDIPSALLQCWHCQPSNASYVGCLQVSLPQSALFDMQVD